MLSLAFAGMATASAWGTTAPGRLIVAAAAVVFALWLGSLAWRALLPRR